MTPDGDDLAEFLELSYRPRPRCGVAIALDSLDADDQRKLTAALNASSVTHAGISRWLVKHGHRVAGGTVRRHRVHECSCDD